MKPQTLGLSEGDAVLGRGLSTSRWGRAPCRRTRARVACTWVELGAEVWVTVETGGERLVARAPGDFRAASGDTVWLRHDARYLRRFDAKTGRAV